MQFFSGELKSMDLFVQMMSMPHSCSMDNCVPKTCPDAVNSCTFLYMYKGLVQMLSIPVHSCLATFLLDEKAGNTG
jgi:hypothetical protein